ncbi:uncharacterized protein LOC113563683 [Drosophila erecta]|uniref:Transcription factor TFIIIC triple barrel domain-containing protein n=1 Tax=Drosophila erecta TaxID=7220 RepID=A0A0Q5WCF9_DROER|nr:uncharacterized protein LOC113563683 [Drosophila erecta]KQS70884.1 uncharacterized protein Dere_GG10674 [Drosophila erecta]
MNDSSDSEYEDQDYLVFADFKNHIHPHQLKHEDAAIKVIGIESDTPMAEVNGSIYRGRYEHSVGTNVFFEKEKDNLASDPLFESVCRQRYKYVNKSTKVISFERVYVDNLHQEVEKSVVAEDDEQTESKPESLKLNITYKEAINKFGEEH